MSARADAPAAARDARSVALRALWIDRTSRRVLETLEAAGVATILLKGPSTAQWLYSPGERDYADLDVLVDVADLPTVDRVLRGEGYVHPRAGARSVELDDHAWTYRIGDIATSGRASEIDIHYTIQSVPVPPENVWRRLREVTEPFPLAGGTVTALDEVGRALILVLHAARDAGRKPQSAEDLRRLARVLPGDTWPRVVELARDLDAVEPFAAGLLLLGDGSERLARLGVPHPSSFATLLNRRDVPTTALRVEELLRTPGLAGKARVALSELWPSTEWLRWWWTDDLRREPAPLPVLRLSRITHLARAAVPAVRARRRVRREVLARQVSRQQVSRQQPREQASAPGPRPEARATSR